MEFYSPLPYPLALISFLLTVWQFFLCLRNNGLMISGNDLFRTEPTVNCYSLHSGQPCVSAFTTILLRILGLMLGAVLIYFVCCLFIYFCVSDKLSDKLPLTYLHLLSLPKQWLQLRTHFQITKAMEDGTHTNNHGSETHQVVNNVRPENSIY